jgi:hypothetical protein
MAIIMITKIFFCSRRYKGGGVGRSGRERERGMKTIA